MRTSVDALPPVSVAETLEGRPGIADLWHFAYEDVLDAELAAAYDGLMTPEERARHQRFIFERDRGLFLATRALVRTVLSRYAAVRPEDWRFTVDERGKPHVAAPMLPRPVHFNLANAHGLVVCLVSVAHARIGVDVEPLDREASMVSLADRFFSRAEAEALREQPAAVQPRRFFEYWTLKESYIKARGMGLALPLDQFSFQLEGAEIRIELDPRLGDTATGWRFALVDTPPRHLVAVGVDGAGAPLHLRSAAIVPLR